MNDGAAYEATCFVDAKRQTGFADRLLHIVVVRVVYLSFQQLLRRDCRNFSLFITDYKYGEDSGMKTSARSCAPGRFGVTRILAGVFTWWILRARRLRMFSLSVLIIVVPEN